MNRDCKSEFKDNTNIKIKFSLVKEEFKDQELKDRYDMLLINNEANIFDKNKIFI